MRLSCLPNSYVEFFLLLSILALEIKSSKGIGLGSR